MVLIIVVAGCGSDADDSADSSDTASGFDVEEHLDCDIDIAWSCWAAANGALNQWQPEDQLTLRRWQANVDLSPLTVVHSDKTSSLRSCLDADQGQGRLCVPRLRPSSLGWLCPSFPTSAGSLLGLATGSNLVRDAVDASGEEDPGDALQSVAQNRLCDILQRTEEEASRELHRDELELTDDDLRKSQAELDDMIQAFDADSVDVPDAAVKELNRSLSNMAAIDTPRMRRAVTVTCRLRGWRFFKGLVCS